LPVHDATLTQLTGARRRSPPKNILPEEAVLERKQVQHKHPTIAPNSEIDTLDTSQKYDW